MTVFDPSAVRRLENDTQSPEFVRSLVGTYLDMLTHRVDRITGALAASDGADALDAALSLQVSSVMTGAVELDELATRIVECLRADDLVAAGRHADSLGDAADRARAALEEYVGSLVGSAQDSADSIR